MSIIKLMKTSLIFPKKKLPYIFIALLAIILFLFGYLCNIPFANKNGVILLFLILFMVALFRDYSYERKLKQTCQNKIPYEYIKKGMFFEIHNDGLKGALETSRQLFSVAQDEILIQAGNLDHNFYENESICSALEKFLQHKGRLRIICASEHDCDPKTHTILEFQHNKDFNIKISRAASRPELHFMVVDDVHYRVEKTHSPGKHYGANIVFNNHFFADFHKYIFIKEWRDIRDDEVL